MEAFNVKFVGAVEKRRVLYDYTLTEYSRKDVTDKAWYQVAAEVSLTVAECKKKWRNLRTAFMRRLKAPPSGSGSKARRTYYLHEALQFILPFTKNTNPPTGNLPEHSQEPEETDLDDPDSQPLPSTKAKPESVDWGPFSRPSLLPLSPPAPTPSLLKSSVDEHPLPLATEHSINTFPASKKQQTGKKRKFPLLESSVDRAVADYYAAKKRTLQPKDGREEPIQQFLNSLVPDLLALTAPQLRSFKRRSLLLIDELMGTTPLESVCEPRSVLVETRLSHSLSPASTFLSSYDPSPSHDPSSPSPEVEILTPAQTLKIP